MISFRSILVQSLLELAVGRDKKYQLKKQSTIKYRKRNNDKKRTSRKKEGEDS